MSCYTADIVVVVAILVCSYYMQRECFRDTLCAQSHSEDTSEGEGSAVEEVVHAARVCSFDGLSVNILVLELTYSGLRPIENSDPDVLGDRILDNLFDCCTCTQTNDVCFQWTLAINQMNYSKTETGVCGGYDCNLNTDEPFPMSLTNATLAQIQIIQTTVESNECLQTTVQCALDRVDPDLKNATFVQAVLSEEQNE